MSSHALAGVKNDPVRSYLLPVLAVSLALVVQVKVVPSDSGSVPLLVFILATAVAGWIGGLRSAFLTILLSGLAATFFLFPPIYSFRIAAPSDDYALLRFTMEAAVIGLLAGSRRRIQQQRDEAVSGLGRACRALEDRYQNLETEYRNRRKADRLLFEDFQRSVNESAVLERWRLYHDLLDRKPLVSSEVRLDRVLNRALGTCAAEIQASNAQITREPLGVVGGSEEELVVLFTELLGNALKYRDNRPARVHFAAKEVANQWVISVADQGVGVLPAHQERVFSPGECLNSKRGPGQGLGLAICRCIIERHGGRIWVRSAGEGATFWFTIPQ